MSVLVSVAIAFVVFLYVRMNRQARQNWLQKLDLPGRWQADRNEGQEGKEGKEGQAPLELTLNGALDRGNFALQQGDTVRRGTWRLSGHTLILYSEQAEQSFDLHLFKPGNIGLEESEGVRHVLHKAADNVVPLRDTSS